jgi:NTP pyrophosphatase (non-canonical NTP hydrolase)
VGKAFLEDVSDISIWWWTTIDLVVHFRDERGWAKYDSPRNLCLALAGEFGELAEVFQFHGDDVEVVKLQSIDNLMQEMADVAIYSLRFALALPPSEQGTESTTRMLEHIEMLRPREKK